METPPSSPSSNRDDNGLVNTDDKHFQAKTSTGSSPSHASSDDDSRHTNSRGTSLTFPTGVTARQAVPTTNRPTSANVTNGTAFKTMSISGNVCPRCSKTVYSAEEVKAAGKVNICSEYKIKYLF